MSERDLHWVVEWMVDLKPRVNSDADADVALLVGCRLASDV